MPRSFPQSSTWSVHNAGEECWNSNAKGDAAETGLQNGNGRIRQREALSPVSRTIALGRCGDLACDHVFNPHMKPRLFDKATLPVWQRESRWHSSRSGPGVNCDARRGPRTEAGPCPAKGSSPPSASSSEPAAQVQSDFHVLRLGTAQFRRRFKRLGGAVQQEHGDQSQLVQCVLRFGHVHGFLPVTLRIRSPIFGRQSNVSETLHQLELLHNSRLLAYTFLTEVASNSDLQIKMHSITWHDPPQR